MNDFNVLFDNLYKYIDRLYDKFIKLYIDTPSGSLIPTQDEEDNIKAFCVLAHAAFEEYFEKVAETAITFSYNLYKGGIFYSQHQIETKDISNENLKKLTNSFIMMVAYSIYDKDSSEALKKHKSKIDNMDNDRFIASGFSAEDLTNLLKTVESYVKEILKESKKYINDNIQNNHGSSLKYLMKLLIPVGIDIPNNLNYHNSLIKLASNRGELAHKAYYINPIISAPDLKDYIVDCLKLCDEVNNSLKWMSSFNVTLQT